MLADYEKDKPLQSESRNLSLTEAAGRFLATLSVPQKQQSEQEVNRFVRWCGRERLTNELTMHEIASYVGGLGVSVTNVVKKLEPVRSFLTYAKKEGLTRTNLAVHLRAGKTTPKKRPTTRRLQQEIPLTSERYSQLQSELKTLKGQRPRIADELRRAAADKDFRENVPLEAAREHQGQVEARIKQIEAALRSATILDEGKVDTAKAGLGTTVILYDLTFEEQLRYTLVSPDETAPARGKISLESPMGKALLGRVKGDVIEVAAPVGMLRYRIDGIE